MVKYLFTGTRRNIPQLLEAVEDVIKTCTKTDFVIHGDATGIDRHVEKMCKNKKYSIPSKKHTADWKTYGRFAGPKRNSEMVFENPNVCFAFPFPSLEQSIGTRDTVRKCVERGIFTIVITL